MNFQDEADEDLIPAHVIEKIIKEREQQLADGRSPEHDRDLTNEEWVALITKHAGKGVYAGEREFKLQMIRVAALAIAAYTAVTIDLPHKVRLKPPSS